MLIPYFCQEFNLLSREVEKKLHQLHFEAWQQLLCASQKQNFVIFVFLENTWEKDKLSIFNFEIWKVEIEPEILVVLSSKSDKKSRRLLELNFAFWNNKSYMVLKMLPFSAYFCCFWCLWLFSATFSAHFSFCSISANFYPILMKVPPFCRIFVFLSNFKRS